MAYESYMRKTMEQRGVSPNKRVFTTNSTALYSYIILWMISAIVTSSLTGWTHTQIDPWHCVSTCLNINVSRPRQYVRNFQTQLLAWKLCFDLNFTEGSNQQYTSLDSDNGMAPSRRRAIFWTNDCLFYWRIWVIRPQWVKGEQNFQNFQIQFLAWKLCFDLKFNEGSN